MLTGATNWTGAGTNTNEEDLLVLEILSVATCCRRNFADLMAIFASEDITSGAPEILGQSSAGVLFNPIADDTQDGDRPIVVGSDPALGAWDVSRGLHARTHRDMYPSWSAVTHLPAGAHVEYKFAVVGLSGAARWEDGPNRVLDVPVTGRAVVTSASVGDTSSSWSPSAPK